MSKPEASVGTPINPRKPIAEVTVLVYDWAPGQTEVQVEFPQEASGGGARVAAKQAEFRALVMSELEQSLKALSAGG